MNRKQRFHLYVSQENDFRFIFEMSLTFLKIGFFQLRNPDTRQSYCTVNTSTTNSRNFNKCFLHFDYWKTIIKK